MVVLVHTLVALLATGAGIIVVAGLSRHGRHRWTDGFLAMAGLTVLTALALPFHGFTPAFSLVVITAALLVVPLAARRRRVAPGRWRAGVVLSLVLVAYAHVLSLIIQSFRHLAPLRELNSGANGWPIAAVHTAAVLVFAYATLKSLRVREPRSDASAREQGS
jgi:hypothetical protein